MKTFPPYRWPRPKEQLFLMSRRDREKWEAFIKRELESPLCGQQTEGERHLASHGSAEPEVTSQDSNGETL